MKFNFLNRSINKAKILNFILKKSIDKTKISASY